MTPGATVMQMVQHQAMLCWRDDSPADVAYAAVTAGIATPSVTSVVDTSGRR